MILALAISYSQEVPGRVKRLFYFDTTRTAYKMTRSTIRRCLRNVLLRVYSLTRERVYRPVA
jgi:hypothetical protein